MFWHGYKESIISFFDFKQEQNYKKDNVKMKLIEGNLPDEIVRKFNQFQDVNDVHFY